MLCRVDQLQIWGKAAVLRGWTVDARRLNHQKSQGKHVSVTVDLSFRAGCECLVLFLVVWALTHPARGGFLLQSTTSCPECKEQTCCSALTKYFFLLQTQCLIILLPQTKSTRNNFITKIMTVLSSNSLSRCSHCNSVHGHVLLF